MATAVEYQLDGLSHHDPNYFTFTMNDVRELLVVDHWQCIAGYQQGLLWTTFIEVLHCIALTYASDWSRPQVPLLMF